MRPSSTALAYDIECDWWLLGTCNFRCQYCFVSTKVLEQRIRIYAEPDWSSSSKRSRPRPRFS